MQPLWQRLREMERAREEKIRERREGVGNHVLAAFDKNCRLSLEAHGLHRCGRSSMGRGRRVHLSV